MTARSTSENHLARPSGWADRWAAAVLAPTPPRRIRERRRQDAFGHRPGNSWWQPITAFLAGRTRAPKTGDPCLTKGCLVTRRRAGGTDS